MAKQSLPWPKIKVNLGVAHKILCAADDEWRLGKEQQ